MNPMPCWHTARVRLLLLALPLLLMACNPDDGGQPSERLTAPGITTAPLSQAVTEGESARFQVAASGSGPLAYQWERDGIAIPDAVADALEVKAVTRDDDGASFTVRVSNAAGRVISAAAILRVRERPVAPAIVAPPQSTSATVGQVVRFVAVASGSAPLHYQWQRNGSDLPESNGAELVLVASADLNDTSYAVKVTNAVGTVTSEAAKLEVVPVPVAPRFIQQPQDTSVLEGERLVLKAAATGTPPFAWQWYRDGNIIGGAIGDTLDLGAAALGASGAHYSVRVWNAAGAALSGDARVEVRVAPFLELLAGNTGGRGNLDGTGSEARLDEGGGIAYDASGNLWLAEPQSHVIRKVTPSGVVSTVAGGKDLPGDADGPAASARFFLPAGIAVMPSGDLVIADYGNHTIRRLSATSEVSTIAGQPGQFGYRDGPASEARFNRPAGVVVGPSGAIYVSEYGNGAVREITPDGQVSTLAGGVLTTRTDGVGRAAGLSHPAAITCATPATLCEGALLVIDSGSSTVRRVRIAPGPAGEPKGEVTTLAGGGSFSDNVPPTMLRFRSLRGVAAVSPTRFLVMDGGDQTVREVDLTVAPGSVKTMAGVSLQSGWGDGRGIEVRFAGGGAMAVRPSTGEVAVRDGGNATLRRLAANGAVLTLAGRSPMRRHLDGAAGAAHFEAPGVAAVDAGGAVYVADGCTVRRVVSGVVSRYAGSSCGHADGPAQQAKFGSSLDLAADASGVVWVADAGDSTVRRIARDGTVTTVAGVSGMRGDVQGSAVAARLGIPSGIAVDSGGDLVVADSFSCRVLRIASATGSVSSIAGDGVCGEARDGSGTAARFTRPYRVTVTTQGEIWVADGTRIRRIAPDGTVSSVAGNGMSGAGDGTGAAVSFNHTTLTMAASPSGGVFVADRASGLVREVLTTRAVRTIIGVRGERGARLGSQPRLSGPTGIAYDGNSRRVIVMDQGGIYSASLP